MRSHAAHLIHVTLLTLFLIHSVAASNGAVEEVCVGNGSPGPYHLSWKHIQVGTASVRVNGLAQSRGLDYTLDADSGTITFTRALTARSAADITYQHDQTLAEPTGAAQTIPLSLDLFRGDRGYLSVNALGKMGDTAQNELTLGFGLGLNSGPNTQISTRFFYAPVTGIPGTQNASPAKRAGMAVSGSTVADHWALFSFGFARAGVGLGDTGSDSLRPGQQTFTVGSHLTPLRQLQAQFDYSQSQPTDAPLAGTTAKTSLALTVTPSDRTSMQANITQNEDRAAGMTQARDLAVTMKPSDSIQVSASYNGKNAPDTDNDSQAISLKAMVTPAKTLSLGTSATQSRLGEITTRQQGVTVSLNPYRRLQIQTGLLLRQKYTIGQAHLSTAVASVSGTAHPLSFMELSGSYKNRMAPGTDTDANDIVDTSAAKIALSPLPSLRLIGTYSQNPDDDSQTVQRLATHGVSLETGMGALGLSGGYDWSQGFDTPDVVQTIHADMGLRFSAATQMTIGYQSRQTKSDTAIPDSTAYTLGLTHSLGDRFNLSLNGKRQQTADVEPDYNATANLGMKF